MVAKSDPERGVAGGPVAGASCEARISYQIALIDPEGR
jgi:hypothetical protein